jgi:hypothetical protein
VVVLGVAASGIGIGIMVGSAAGGGCGSSPKAILPSPHLPSTILGLLIVRLLFCTAAPGRGMHSSPSRQICDAAAGFSMLVGLRLVVVEGGNGISRLLLCHWIPSVDRLLLHRERPSAAKAQHYPRPRQPVLNSIIEPPGDRGKGT